MKDKNILTEEEFERELRKFISSGYDLLYYNNIIAHDRALRKQECEACRHHRAMGYDLLPKDVLDFD